MIPIKYYGYEHKLIVDQVLAIILHTYHIPRSMKTWLTYRLTSRIKRKRNCFMEF